MRGILSKYGLKPATGNASMMAVAGDYSAEIAFDVTEMTTEDLQTLISELESLGLQTSVEGSNLKVSGEVRYFYSRGNDAEGRKAVWLSFEGPITELIAESLVLSYAQNGWPLSSGRLLREVVVRTDNEVKLPDGTTIFVGATAEYNASLLATDGSVVHPRLTNEQKQLLGVDAGTGEEDAIDGDPFK